MPAEEGIGLYNVQSLLPELGKSRKKDQAITNIIGQPWVLNLAVEGNQLLAQNGVFNQQVSPAVGQILQGTQCK